MNFIDLMGADGDVEEVHPSKHYRISGSQHDTLSVGTRLRLGGER